MTGHQKDNIFVLTLMHGGPRGGRGGPFLARKSALFYATPMYITPVFQIRRTRLNGIICPPCPEVTLDNFGFLVGGRFAARGVVFRLPGRILAQNGPPRLPRGPPCMRVNTKKLSFWCPVMMMSKKMDDFGKKWI